MNAAATNRTKIAVFGSTGSIGASALDVLRHHRGRFVVAALAAGRKLDLLLDQVREFRPPVAVIAHPSNIEALVQARATLKREGVACELLSGEQALAEVARTADYGVMLGAITGAAGLAANIEAVKRGKRIALANKESLVMTGPILTRMAAQTGAELIPVDSEHSAVWQCLRAGRRADVSRIILTASGGPFRMTPLDKLKDATIEQALRHPTWVMGPKITVDSATLMNKALEIIEARWLFDLRTEQIDVLIHPQSVVHSMVEFNDRSIIAQLGPTDMKIPIQLALTWPERLECPTKPSSVADIASLTFEAPDEARFPALRLGYEVAAAGGTSGAVFSAANEIAVARFLARDVSYLDVYRVVEAVTHRHSPKPEPSLEDVLAADAWAREEAAKWVR